MESKKSLHSELEKESPYTLSTQHKKSQQNEKMSGCMVIYPEDYDLHEIVVD